MAPQPRFRKLTPVLVVEAIEPVLPFWSALGFGRTVELPGDDGRLGFVILAREGIELMYQTLASVQADEPAVAERVGDGSAALFIEVADLGAVQRLLPADCERLVAERTTFYGARETIVREPGGHVVTFAEFGGPHGGE